MWANEKRVKNDDRRVWMIFNHIAAWKSIDRKKLCHMPHACLLHLSLLEDCMK